MHNCSWITDGKQCENTTNNLVCSKCRKDKDKLYNAYKESEKTVLSAINTEEPRGDIYEVTKVIGRISRTIQLRNEFTQKLAIQVRDPGHEYHISKLFLVMNKYRNYLSLITSNSVEQEQEEEEAIINECVIVLGNQIDNIVKTDPFLNFDSILQEYCNSRNEEEKFTCNIAKQFNCDNSTAHIIIRLYWNTIHAERACISNCKMLSNQTLTCRFCYRGGTVPKSLIFDTWMKSREPYLLDLAKWIEGNFIDGIRLLMFQYVFGKTKFIFLAFTSGRNVYSYVEVALFYRHKDGLKAKFVPYNSASNKQTIIDHAKKIVTISHNKLQKIIRKKSHNRR